MTQSNLPPQAYTVEMLKEAYSWLLNQNPSIRALARSDSDIVSLFRQRNQSGDKKETFKTHLTELAQDFKEFEDRNKVKTHPPVNQTFIPTPETEKTSPPPPSPTIMPKPLNPNDVNLDEKTQISLHLAREHLNLESLDAALRVLVVLGLEKLKEVLPNKF